MQMPITVARSAWECAWVLWTDYRDRLAESQRQRMLLFTFRDEEHITAEEGGEIFALYGEITGERRV